jgi:glycosyltransferase involved in cell wall biosynthesis
VALYRTADALLITSEHEGFCVPIVEAMSLGVPVVAVPHTAVPDTGGSALRYAEADPEQLAMAIKELLADGHHREEQVLAGWHRYEQHFSPAAIEMRFWQLLAG